MAKDTKKKKDGLLGRLRSAKQPKVDPELTALLEGVQADPTNMRARLKLADYYLKIEDSVRALDQYLTVAETYAEKGFYPKAVAVYKQALQIDPNMIEVYLKLANLYHKLGLMPEVVEQYQKAAAIYERQGKEREALDIRRMLLDLDPTNVVGRMKLGQRYLEKGFTQEAVSEFLRAADIFEQQSKFAELQRLLEGILDRGVESFEVINRLVEFYRSQNRPDLALTRLAKLTGELAGSVSTLELTAELAMELNKPLLAIKSLERAGSLYEQINRQDKVREICERILNIDAVNLFATEHLQILGVTPGAAQPPVPEVPEEAPPAMPAPVEMEEEVTIEEEVEEIEELPEMEEIPEVEEIPEIEEITEIEEFPAEPETAAEPVSEEIIIEDEAPARAAEAAEPEIEEIIIEEEPAAPQPPTAEVEEIPIEEISIEEGALPEGEPVIEEEIVEPVEEVAVDEFTFEEAPAEPVAAAEPEPEEALDLAQMTEEEASQRLEEAIDIYLKYNLRDKAIEFLTVSLERNPQSLPILEKMMSIYRDGGDERKAGEILEQLIDLAQQQGNADKLEQYLSLMVEYAPEDLAAAEKLAEHYAETEPERAAVHYFDLARRYQNADRPQDAERLLNRLLEIDPANTDAHQELLEVFQQTGQNDKVVAELYYLYKTASDEQEWNLAEGYLNRILELRPMEDQVQNTLLEVYEKSGQRGKVVDLLQRLAVRYQNAGTTVPATQYAERWMAADPQNPAAHAKVKELYLEAGRTADAVAQLFTISHLAAQQQQPREAANALREILNLDPVHLAARERLRDLYLELGDTESAVSEIMLLARSAMDQGEAPQALELFDQILELSPLHEQALRNKVTILHHQGRDEDAAEALMSVAQKLARADEIDKAEALLRVALTFPVDPAPAREALKDLFLVSGQNEKAVAELVTLAAIAEQAGAAETALSYWGEVSGLDPQNIEARKGIARLHLALGNPSGAVSEMLTVSDMLTQRGNREEAIDTLRDALTYDPQNEVVAARLIDLYLESGQIDLGVKLLVEAGDRAREASRLGQSRDLYARIVRIQPEHVDARGKLKHVLVDLGQNEDAVEQLMALARLYDAAGEMSRVEETYLEVLDLDPEHEMAAQALKDHYLAVGRVEAGLDMLQGFIQHAREVQQFDKAKSFALEMLAVAADDRRAILTLAELALATGDVREAINQYLRLATLAEKSSRPDDAEGYLSKVLDLDTNLVEAHQRFKRLLLARDEKPGAIDHIFALADIAIREGDTEVAETFYREVLEIDPNHEPALEHLVNLFVAEGEGQRGIPEMFRLAEMLRDKSDYVHAAKYLTQILDLEPDNERAIELLSDVHIAAGDTGKAIAELFSLEQAAETKGDYEGALAIVDRILSLDAESPASLSKKADLEEVLDHTAAALSTLLTLARVQAERNLLEDAERSVRRAQKLEAANPEAHALLLDILTRAEAPRAIIDELLRFNAASLEAGDPEVMEQTAQRILALDPTFERAHRLLVQTYHARGDNERAVDELFALAELAVEAGRTGDAEALYKEVLDLDEINRMAADRLTAYYVETGRENEAVRLLLARGDALTKKDRIPESREAYRRVLELMDGQEDALRKLKDSYLATADLAEAVDVLLKLVTVSDARREDKKAIAALEEIIDLDPRNWEARDGLSNRYLQTGQSDKAVALLFAAEEAMGETWDNERRLLNLNEILRLESGNKRALRRTFELYKTTNRRAEALNALLQMADLAAVEHDREGQESLLREALAVDAAHLESHHRLQAMFAAAGEPEKQADELFTIAQLLQKTGDFTGAQTALMDVVDLGVQKQRALQELAGLYAMSGQPQKQLEIRLQLAAMAVQNGDFSGAEAKYNEILAENPDHVISREALIRLLADSGRTGKAAQQAVILADRARKSGETAEAIRRYEQVLTFDAAHLTARRQIKNLLVEVGQIDEALSQLRILAQLEDQAEAYDMVEDYLREILHLRPEDREARENLVALYERTDQPDKAVIELLEVADLTAEGGDRPAALNLIEKAAALEPGNEATQRRLKDAYLDLGDQPRAIETLFRLYEVNLQANKRHSAEKCLRDILALDPANSQAKEKVLDLFRTGATLEEQVAELFAQAEEAYSIGNRNKAITALQQILHLDPEQPEARTRLQSLYVAAPAAQPTPAAVAASADAQVMEAEARVFEEVEITPAAGTLEEEITLDWGEPGEVETPISAEEPIVEAVEEDVFGAAPEAEVEELDVFAEVAEPSQKPTPVEKPAAKPITPMELTTDEFLSRGEMPVREPIGRPQPATKSRILEEFRPFTEAAPTEIEEQPVAKAAGELEPEIIVRPEKKAPAAESRTTVADLLGEMDLEEFGVKSAAAVPEPAKGDLFDEIFGTPKPTPAAGDALDSLIGGLEGATEAGQAKAEDDIFQSFVASLSEEARGAGDAQTHYELGIAFREMDSMEEAIAEFEKALAKDSGKLTFEINYELGQCYASMGKYDMAVEYLESALSEGTQDEQYLLDLRFDLGVALKQIGQLEKAKQHFKEVDSRSSNYRGAKAEIAECEKPKEGKGKGKKKSGGGDDNIGFI